MRLGERLKELRIATGLSVRDAASQLSKSPGYISRLEVRDEVPSPELLLAMAQLYGAEFEQLLVLAKKTQLDQAAREIDARQASALNLYRKARR